MINKLIKLATTLEVLEEEAYSQVDSLIIKSAGKYDKDISFPPFGIMAIKWWDVANSTRKKWENSMRLDLSVDDLIENKKGMFEESSNSVELGEQAKYQFTEFKRFVNLALEFERLKFFPEHMSLEQLLKASHNEKEYSEILLMSIDINMNEFMENIHKLPKSNFERFSYNSAVSEMWNAAQKLSMLRDQVWNRRVDRDLYQGFIQNTSIAWSIHNIVKGMGPPPLFM